MRVARYSGFCVVCKNKIEPGELIVRMFPFWVHEECAKKVDEEGFRY